MFRWGVLSTAKIGWEHFIPAINQADNGILAGIASRDLKKATKLAVKFGALAAYGSYEELLASPDIDGVYIPLPTSQHTQWAIKAAKAGKHVLCEKPIALKANDINRIIKARDKYNVVIAEAFMVTYHPQWHKVRELIKKGAIGKLRHVQASFCYYNVDAKNMRNKPELGGGVIPDIGVYPTVVTRFATGKEPITLEATIEFDLKFKTDRYASVRADFGDFDQTFYISTQMGLRQTCIFHGDKGFIELSAPFNSNLYEGDEVRVHNQNHSETKVYRYTGLNQYRLEAETFAKACMSGKKKDIAAVYSLEESYKNQRVIDAIYKSHNAKKAVRV